MSDQNHVRAKQLIAQERVEGISQVERDWLSTHLQECASCAAHAQETEQTLRSLRTAAISVPAGLASRTQFRVQLRLQEMREREPKRRALWAACAVSWLFGIVSAPYVWRLFQWVGERTGVPKLVWQLGFGLWWTIPALFVLIVLLMEKVRQGGDQNWLRQSR
jgi:predicted anti-sigma-YlaC factor YlaD